VAAMIDSLALLTAQICSYLQASKIEQTGYRITSHRPGMTVFDLFRPRINVYLMEVNENPSRRNDFLSSGGIGQNPPIVLDLRYLITFYGPGNGPQNLLQGTVKAMAAKPVFDPASAQNLSSNVHFMLESTNDRELEKVWSMMGVRHAPSLIYRANGLIV
jgi:hypothetical protein